MKKYFLIPLLCVACFFIGCQHPEEGPGPDIRPEEPAVDYALIETSPVVIEPGYDGEIVIYFNPAKGSKGMVGAAKCYAHTGLITSESANTGDWKYATKTWRGADSPELTKEGERWKLVIPSICSFYGCPASTEVVALAFVFHDGPGGSKEGKTDSGKDILVYIGEEAQPSDIWSGFVAADVVSEPRPSGVVNGIYYDENDPTKVTLCTYAASKSQAAKHVFVLGDMTDWRLSNDYQMKRDGNYFWLTLTGLEPGKEYRLQYAIERADGVKKQISDLYSTKLLHPDDAYEPKRLDPSLMSYPMKGADGGYVTVIQTGKTTYQWSDATLRFVRPDKNNLIIYELWVYDYTPERSFAGLMNRLDYIEGLGVNAIELMPVCEFDGNYNWGYSPNHYFAVDKAYGTDLEFRQLIDACHERGMAVIMDMVFNHATGLNPMNKLYPYGNDLKENPWFNVTPPHGDNVYEDWNHDFAPAHDMFTRALRYWLEEYHVDGYRMDLSHGLCGATYNATTNINDYYTNAVQAASPGAYFILEHWGSKMGAERPQLINNGMLCWNNTNNAYCQTAMGWLKDGDAFDEANKDGYVSYCESHDEERMQYKCKQWGNGAVKTDDAVRLGRVAENVAFNVLLNGSHMIWQYEEIGYDFSINSSADDPDGTSNDNRCSKKPRPENRGYFSSTNRMAAYKDVAAVCYLRTHLLPEVFAGNPTSVSLNSGYKLRTIQWGGDVYVAANFDVTEAQTATLPAGTWYDYLAGGIQQGANQVVLQPGQLKVYTGRSLKPAEVPSSFNF